jgi:hypothetical protein
MTTRCRRPEPHHPAAQRVSWEVLESFLDEENQIIDCPDAEAMASFKHSISDEWLARSFGQEKPKTMASLTSLMT